MEINIKELPEIIYKYANEKEPLMIHGPPGIGKSDGVRAVAIRLAKEWHVKHGDGSEEFDLDKHFNEGIPVVDKFNFLDLRLSQLDPSDLRGIPIPDKDSGVVSWMRPDIMPVEGFGVLFLDEFNIAPLSIQGAAMQLLLSRRLGSTKLSEGYSIILAGNRTGDGANVYPMPQAVRNRMGHLDLLEPGINEWCEWAYANGIRDDIIGYLRFKSDELFVYDPKSKEHAWPSPRTWAKLSSLLNRMTGKDENELHTMSLISSSIVGEAAGKSYVNFLQLTINIDIDEIIRQPSLIREYETETGKTWSIMSSLLSRYKNDKEGLWKSMLNIASSFDKDEFTAYFVRSMHEMDPGFLAGKAVGSSEYDKIYNKVGELLFKAE